MCIVAHRRLVQATLILALVTTTASGQAQNSPPNNPESEVARIRTENAALREELRRIEEQQKTLLKIVNELQQRLNPISTVAAAQPPPVPEPSSPAAAQALAPSTSGTAQLASDQNADQPGRTYDEGATGFLLAKSSEGSNVPFQLNLWDTTQVRFTNTTLGNTSFTDHLGVQQPVTRRNDFSLNRNLFHFTGYVFDPRLKFNLITWASNTTASVVIGGYVRWEFNNAFRASGGYWGSPGSRTLAGTFPYFATVDRSMADNFFRPSFTQGVWIDGEPGKFYYMVFVGDGLNTLVIPLSKVDTGLVTSGTVSWEPLGRYGPRGRANGMYDDYEDHEKPVIRIGTSFTRSRENRFANLQEQGNPENNALYNSDGVNTFATGAFAPGVTVTDATYRMWAFDAGVKWHGMAFNSQGFARWLNSFVADGPLPLSSTFDMGAEMVLSYFVLPKKFEVYERASFVYGQFRDSNEYGTGIRFYPVKSYRVWLAGEGLRMNRCPIGSAISSYSAGYSGWEPLAQLMFTF